MLECRAACFDVHYCEDSAKACALVFDTGPCEKEIAHYTAILGPVPDYIPGQFYKRELPCILQVYRMVKEEIGLAIVDGFVTLGEGRKGLGGYLFEELGGRIPVIGVAKTFFKGCDKYAEVYRGTSTRPIFVTCVGMDLVDAASLITHLEGQARIPDMLARVDRLTREG